ncbi:response regulator [Butyrivibrio sp. X503]|uniref:response regulator transcription factor n=1 Tax=Butyrivibrio sp. X503 TaxID=2364878 RepID=UPI000EAA85B5|nr:response regulator [Butyrivibrio sp. X503]RKM58082.1 response regulator [Butyrivibrio sp. X503]
MKKVVIIDDEPIIVQGLSKSVDWAKYGCEVVGTAGDGVEGKRVIEELHPDILFLDICMPQMDGLTMIAGLKSEYSDMQIAILTGFRDFEYAQKAINLGVSRFLLKPSNMDEINEAIAHMVERSDKIKGTSSDSSEDGESEEAVADNFIVRNALSYIEEHYNEKILLSDVADKVYVSQWHLSKLLNKETGKNFSEILNTVRIKKASELLKDPSKRISDVAEEVGFLDVAHFSRVFKKVKGISANEYRNHTK